jgi:hypothetical protein
MAEGNSPTPVDSGATVQKAPGESVGFDQMEALMDQDVRLTQVDKQSSTKKPDNTIPDDALDDETEVKKGATKDDQVEEDAPLSFEEQDRRDQAPKKAKKEEEVVEEPVVEEKVDADVKPAKIYTVKHGESEVAIPADLKFEVPVKGEPQEVTFQELRDDYSGKTNWNHKFSELDKERKAHESSRELLDNTVNTMYSQLVDQKDWKAFIITAAEAFNTDPFEIMNEVEDQILEANNNGDDFELSPEDRQLKRKAAKADYWKERYDRDRQQTATKAKQTQTRASLDDAAIKFGMVDQHGNIDNKLIVESFDKLVAAGQDKNTVTAEQIGTQYLKSVRSQQIETVLKEVAPDMGGDELNDNVAMLTDELAKPEITKEKAEEVVREVYGKSNTKIISEKVRKAEEVRPESPDKPVAPASDPMFFDDLEDV